MTRGSLVPRLHHLLLIETLLNHRGVRQKILLPASLAALEGRSLTVRMG